VVSPTFIEPQTFASLRGLKLRARHIVEGYLAGLHRSHHRGFSVEFAEHREYAPGDDLRYVDWKLYGRSDKVYVRRYEEETSLTCYLALDISPSMTYRGSGAALSKLEYAEALAAAIAWLVLEQQDAVALATFDNKVRQLLPAAGAAAQLDRVIGVMESSASQHKSAIGQVLHDLAHRLTRRGIVFVVSDFLDGLEPLVAGLAHLVERRHDVNLIQILDPAELDFSFTEPTAFQGLEGLSETRADPQLVRSAYLRELESFCGRLRDECFRRGAHYFQMRTDECPATALATALTVREGSRR
jgi:uncharacterized protein (DUF58 family)